MRKNSFHLVCGAVPTIFESSSGNFIARVEHQEQQENSFDLACGEILNIEFDPTEPVAEIDRQQELTESSGENDPKVRELSETIARLKQDLLQLELSSDARHQNMGQSIISLKNKLRSKTVALHHSQKDLGKSRAENTRLQNENEEMRRRFLSASTASNVSIVTHSKSSQASGPSQQFTFLPSVDSMVNKTEIGHYDMHFFSDRSIGCFIFRNDSV